MLHKIDNSAFLLLEFSLIVFEFDFVTCPLCNSNTLWIILILLSRNAEQDKKTCCVQE